LEVSASTFFVSGSDILVVEAIPVGKADLPNGTF